MMKWCIQKKYGIMFALLIFCVAYHAISKSYGLVIPPDEFGYWSYAARLAGYDWSDIASLNPYYSYGYSLVLFPIFLAFQDGIGSYRAALSVNYALLALCFLMLRKIDIGAVEKSIIQKGDALFCAAVAVFYPAWLFYAETTLAEILLVTLYAALCMSLLNYFRTEKKIYMALSALAMLYMYFVHMRTIGILISGVAALAIHAIMQNVADNNDKARKPLAKKPLGNAAFLLVLLLFIAIALAAGFWVKQCWTDMVYGGASDSLKNVNDYAGQVGKLAYICTSEGFKNLIISVAGKLLYLGLASFGLAYFGLEYAFRKLISRHSDTGTRCFYLFILLSVAAAVMICAIATAYPGRVDALAYGRYHEYVMPLLMLMGIKALREGGISAKKAAAGIIAIIAAECVCTWLVAMSLRENGQTSFFGHMMCAISWLYDSDNFAPVAFYWRAYFAGAALTVLSCILIWSTGQKSRREIFLMLIVAAQIAIGMRLSSIFIDASRLGGFRDTLMAEKIYELNADNDRKVYYSTGGEDYGNIGILQFAMRDTKINIVKRDFDLEVQNERDLLIVGYESEQLQTLGSAYGSCFTIGHFALFYNE